MFSAMFSAAVLKTPPAVSQAPRSVSAVLLPPVQVEVSQAAM